MKALLLAAMFALATGVPALAEGETQNTEAQAAATPAAPKPERESAKRKKITGAATGHRRNHGKSHSLKHKHRDSSAKKSEVAKANTPTSATQGTTDNK